MAASFYQRISNHLLCYGAGGPFFALGWFLTGVLLTYYLFMLGLLNTRMNVENTGRHLPPNKYEKYAEPATKMPPNTAQNEPKDAVDDNKPVAGSVENLLENTPTDQNEDVTELLSKNIRVMCMLLSTEKYHNDKAAAVKKTWGRRCDKLVFLSDKEDTSLGAIKASTYSDYDHLWSKVRNGFRWAYDHHLNDFDWFYKGDDDTFVIMENLRALLVQFDPNKPVYVGHEYGPNGWANPASYYSGGSGYVLSRRAVARLVEEGFPVLKYCHDIHMVGPEDIEMARCMESIGIRTTDTRDDIGRQRFIPLRLDQHLVVGTIPEGYWFRQYEKYPLKDGEECCSSLAIAFHYVKPVDMVQLEYFLYRLHLFGRNVFLNGAEQVAERQKTAYKLIQEKLLRNNYTSSPSDGERFTDHRNIGSQSSNDDHAVVASSTNSAISSSTSMMSLAVTTTSPHNFTSLSLSNNYSTTEQGKSLIKNQTSSSTVILPK